MYPKRQSVKDLIKELEAEVKAEAKERELKFRKEEKKVLVKNKLVSVLKNKKIGFKKASPKKTVKRKGKLKHEA